MLRRLAEWPGLLLLLPSAAHQSPHTHRPTSHARSMMPSGGYRGQEPVLSANYAFDLGFQFSL